MSQPKKNKFDFRGAYNRAQEIGDRITEMADLCQKENRQRNEAEEQEYRSLVSEQQLLQMRISAAANDYELENPNAREEAVSLIRENAKAGRKTEIILNRSTLLVGSSSAAGSVRNMAEQAYIPLNVQDILEPLVEGFILDKLGLPMPTGLAGDFVWPTYELVSASVLDENVQLDDSTITLGQLTARPVRMGVAIPVTNQTLNQTNGVIESIIRSILPKSIQLLLNKIICGLEPIGAAKSGTSTIQGPFVAADRYSLSATPTFKELNGMKAKILETGIDGNNMCWVMSKSMKAVLEGEPINSSGVYVPMVQNDHLCGLPIYTTNEIRKTVTTYYKITGVDDTSHIITYADGTASAPADASSILKTYYNGHPAKTTDDTAVTFAANKYVKEVTTTEYIGLGDFRYQPMGLFGNIRFVVDPYSKARNDAVDFILNCDYGTTTLRPEAFLLGACATATA